jgi:prolyl oligopeptidase
MLLTADHDDRVVPLHSFKHAAQLQHTLPNNPNPLLLRVDTKSGHGAGKVRFSSRVSEMVRIELIESGSVEQSTEKKIEEAVDKYGFVSQSMGLKWFP